MRWKERSKIYLKIILENKNNTSNYIKNFIESEMWAYFRSIRPAPFKFFISKENKSPSWIINISSNEFQKTNIYTLIKNRNKNLRYYIYSTVLPGGIGKIQCSYIQEYNDSGYINKTSTHIYVNFGQAFKNFVPDTLPSVVVHECIRYSIFHMLGGVRFYVKSKKGKNIGEENLLLYLLYYGGFSVGSDVGEFYSEVGEIINSILGSGR